MPASAPSAPAPVAGETLDGVAAQVWRLLDGIADPEIPVISLVDLGIVRSVRCTGPTQVEVGVSPTYSGCPATEVIRGLVLGTLRQAGFTEATVVDVLAPPWTSDWLSERGREKLREYGIAPPAESVSSPRRLLGEPAIACPRCGALATTRLSEFASTPCKALHRCDVCLEPFEYFKCI